MKNFPVLTSTDQGANKGGSDTYGVDATGWMPTGETLEDITTADVYVSDSDVVEVTAPAIVNDVWAQATFTVTALNYKGTLTVKFELTTNTGRKITKVRGLPIRPSDED